jgi:hypothetical protein
MAQLSTGARRLGPALLGPALAITVGLALCACGSASSGSSGGSALASAQAPAMLVQCGFDRGTVSPGGMQPWYSQGQILPQAGPRAGHHRAQFMAWWSAHSSAPVSGKTLAAWRTWAVAHDRLPPTVCGSFAPAASLRAQIFPGESNPWKS